MITEVQIIFCIIIVKKVDRIILTTSEKKQMKIPIHQIAKKNKISSVNSLTKKKFERDI